MAIPAKAIPTSNIESRISVTFKVTEFLEAKREREGKRE